MGFAGLAGMPTAMVSNATDEVYLFSVDAQEIRVVPGHGLAAKVVLMQPKSTRFSDRPFRDEKRVSVGTMLDEFGWDSQTHRLSEASPNAAIAIAGQRSQVVDIRKATVFPDRLVLSVRSIGSPLLARSGPGALFIDDVVVFPVAETLSFGYDDLTAAVTLTNEGTATVKLLHDGQAEGMVTVTAATPTDGIIFQDKDHARTVTIVVTATFMSGSVRILLTGTSISTSCSASPCADTLRLPAQWTTFTL